MSALVELTTRIGDIADRLDMSTGPGADALRRHYIEPTMAELNDVPVRAFGSNRQPFKNKNYKATVDYVVQTGPTTVVFRLGPTGFWVFGQYGSKPHLIAAKTAKRIKGASYGHPVRGPIHHPGSKGKHAIDQAWKAIRHNQHERITAAIDELMGDTHG